MVTVARKEYNEALRQREKRKKAREGPGEAATEVASQVKRLFYCVTGLLQETELWCTFSLDDLYSFQKMIAAKLLSSDIVFPLRAVSL